MTEDKKKAKFIYNITIQVLESLKSAPEFVDIGFINDCIAQVKTECFENTGVKIEIPNRT